MSDHFAFAMRGSEVRVFSSAPFRHTKVPAAGLFCCLRSRTATRVAWSTAVSHNDDVEKALVWHELTEPT